MRTHCPHCRRREPALYFATPSTKKAAVVMGSGIISMFWFAFRYDMWGDGLWWIPMSAVAFFSVLS